MAKNHLVGFLSSEEGAKLSAIVWSEKQNSSHRIRRIGNQK